MCAHVGEHVLIVCMWRPDIDVLYSSCLLFTKLSMNPELVTSVTLARRLDPGISSFCVPSMGTAHPLGTHTDFRHQNSVFTLSQSAFMTATSPGSINGILEIK